ncbi:hypothetical protein NPIL_454491 [Nephila pilipes]|uniref:Uncharacterized protein n=1 Tax=Nephila pilipes TaxID=299642 RepID=A0A8X6TY27_NEPPI|nr:hypothetical protein NPIL_454491 [Nephila pilipes]
MDQSICTRERFNPDEVLSKGGEYLVMKWISTGKEEHLRSRNDSIFNEQSFTIARIIKHEKLIRNNVCLAHSGMYARIRELDSSLRYGEADPIP